MPPERTQASSTLNQNRLKPYSHPRSKIQYYEEEDQDVITLVSSDGQAFKVHRQILIFNSAFWKEFLGLPAVSEPIKLPEKAAVIYAVLFMMHEHEVDVSEEPDANTINSVRGASGMFSELDQAQILYSHHLIAVTKLLDKWQLKSSLDTMMRRYWLKVLKDSGSCVATVLFKLACELQWEDVSIESVRYLRGIRWTERTEREPDYSCWFNTGGLPFWMSREDIERIGWPNYQNYVIAVAESLKIPTNHTIDVDWEKVARKFKLAK